MKKHKLSILCLLPAFLLPSCNNLGSYKGNEDNFFTKDIQYKENFKILTLADIHFSFTDDLAKHCNLMRKTIEKANPDLIVMNGDLFTYAHKSTAKYLFDFIDNVGGEKNIPWTFTNGNHDDQGEFNEYYLIELAMKHKNARVADVRFKDLSGRTNYIINLMNGSSIKHQVYLVDSHGYTFKDGFGYEAIQPDQVQWYEDMVNYTTVKEGHLVKSSMFFHIVTKEIKEWYENGEFDTGTEVRGTKMEDFAAPNVDHGFASKVIELGSTKSVVYAHDHKNDIIFTHGGVQFAYSYTATDRIYWTEEHLGGLLLTIQDDGTSLMDQIHVEY